MLKQRNEKPLKNALTLIKKASTKTKLNCKHLYSRLNTICKQETGIIPGHPNEIIRRLFRPIKAEILPLITILNIVPQQLLRDSAEFPTPNTLESNSRSPSIFFRASIHGILVTNGRALHAFIITTSIIFRTTNITRINSLTENRTIADIFVSNETRLAFSSLTSTINVCDKQDNLEVRLQAINVLNWSTKFIIDNFT